MTSQLIYLNLKLKSIRKNMYWPNYTIHISA